ncbi:GTP cyclohydrolase 1 feedback regulatory protein [Oryzias melastigma]|nr:GTP cyclohydrolase 1 feedback regulatory protein [Oryzias melastigma]
MLLTETRKRAVIGCSRWAFPQERRLQKAAACVEDSSSAIPEEEEESNPGAGMPYILISTQIRLETGPTNVGDEFSDPAVMNYLGARKTTVLGNNFSEYHVEEPPRLVLDKLEKIGFRVLSMTGVGQTLVWCLHKEAE